MFDFTTFSQWCISITGVLVFLKYISAHRTRLQNTQDKHEKRIGIVEDKIIIHDEHLKTLWKER